nr:translesion error-prone DNA polymerase V autoproteolytic subunit [uncultured Desulfobulbus sp.]
MKTEILARPADCSHIAIPLVHCSIAAGFPSPAEDYVDQALDLNELLVTNPPATFFVRVNGDSMIDAGILHGDILSVDRSEEAHDGSIVIALINGELTVKELSLYPKVRLIPHNSAYPVIELNENDDFEIFGRVKGLVRVFGK